MPTTGLDFYKYCQSIDDEAFSDYTSPAKFNVFAMAMLSKCIEWKYATNERQSTEDDLFSLKVTDYGVTVTSNKALLSIIPDYLHLLAVKPFFEEPVSLSITNASNTTPIRLTLDSRSKLRSKSLVKVNGVGGNLAANTTSYLKQLKDFQYAMYTDALLSNPVSGNGTYTNGGAIKLVHNTYVQQIRSDEKFSALSAPTINNPRCEIANSSLTFYPTEYTCYLASIDYLKKPTVFIDANNNVLDLELSYTKRFLYFLADKMKQQIKESESDYPAAAAATKELNTP